MSVFLRSRHIITFSHFQFSLDDNDNTKYATILFRLFPVCELILLFSKPMMMASTSSSVTGRRSDVQAMNIVCILYKVLLEKRQWNKLLMIFSWPIWEKLSLTLPLSLSLWSFILCNCSFWWWAYCGISARWSKEWKEKEMVKTHNNSFSL